MKQKSNDAAAAGAVLIHRTPLGRRMWNLRGLYFLAAIPVVYVIIFNYSPMYGVLMAFERYQPRQGVIGSPWVGLYNFQRLFTSPSFFGILRNTLLLNIYGLFVGFPFPIILAIFVNHFLVKRFTKIVQSLTFAPHFLSTVVMVGLLGQVLSYRIGIVNFFLKGIGMNPVNFLASPVLFPHIYVWSGIWQGTGYGAILYIATLVGVDLNLHEAALIDGANMWQRVWHIDLPTIRPIIVISLILSMGGMLGSSFEKAYLLQNTVNIEASEVISTYVYKMGIANSRPDYSFGTAIGLFQNVVGVILVLLVNKIADKLTGEGMF
jgi:multiple sugar transport system permease protein/putative aldouronate transport system permease protein